MRREILFNILARLIDRYVPFTYTETMLRNAPRKRLRRRFVRIQGWWNTVVNNYSDERFKYALRMSRNTFNYPALIQAVFHVGERFWARENWRPKN